MKKAYMMMRHFTEESHLAPKFSGQIKALMNLGYDVSHLIIENDGIYLAINNEKQQIMRKGYFKSKINRILAYRYIHMLSRKIAKEQGYFDLVYIRYSIPFFSYVKTLKILKTYSAKVVVEIPTYPHQKEYKSDRRFWRKPLYPIMEILNKKASKFVDLYVLIGEKANCCYNRPAINITNGIALESIPAKNIVLIGNQINIIAVASMAKWHGYDRLIWGLYNYIANGGNEDISIHLVGPDGDGSLLDWKKLTKELHLEKYILFEGAKYGNELANVIDRCDIACDALSSYSKGLEPGNSLKIAEYCARGIPFIWTKNVEDNSIPYSFGGFPNDNSPIEIDKIIQIVKQIRNETDVALKMRKYAQENLSWESQYRLIFNALS